MKCYQVNRNFMKLYKVSSDAAQLEILYANYNQNAWKRAFLHPMLILSLKATLQLTYPV